MRAPFEAVSEDEDAEKKVLTGHSEFNRTAEKRARIMSSVGHVTRTRSVYVVDRARQDSVEGTALVERDEVERIGDAEELKDLIRERAEVEA
jgi:putative transcriptional regulator